MSLVDFCLGFVCGSLVGFVLVFCVCFLVPRCLFFDFCVCVCFEMFLVVIWMGRWLLNQQCSMVCWFGNFR